MNLITADADCERADTTYWPAVLWSTVAKTTTNPHSGTRCLQLNKDDTRNYGLTKPTLSIPAFAHVELISCWYRTDGYGNFRICTSGGTTLFFGGSPTGWTYAQILTTCAANASNFYLQAYRGVDTRPTSVWIDDACVSIPTTILSPHFRRRRQ